MAFIVYPNSGYNSFVSQSDAETYFESCLHAGTKWMEFDDLDAVLLTAFRSINELDITINPTVAIELQAVKDAQCEQGLHEILKIGENHRLQVLELDDIKLKKRDLPRYSERALGILRPYLTYPTIKATR